MTVAWWAGLRLLFRERLWRRWTLASFLARLPTTMTLLALVLAGEEATGSIAVGAQLAGVATFTAGLAALWRGRQLDRGELRGGLQRACLATGTVLAAQAAAVVAGAPVALLFALAFLQGVAMAAIQGGFRALLVPVVPPAKLARANVMEAVFVEVAFVSGPALAGVLALGVGAAGVLAAMALSSALAAVVAGGLPRYATPVTGASAAPLRVRGARPVYGLAVGTGICFGLLESAVPARLPELGLAAANAGLLVALIAAGSAVSGLLASGWLDSAAKAHGRAVLLFGALGLLAIPAALAGSPFLLGLALLGAGLPIAPLNALGALLLSDAVPRGRQAEGFAVYIAAVLVGAGIGQSLTGQLLNTLGAQALLGLSGAIPLAMALVLATSLPRPTRSRRLRYP